MTHDLIIIYEHPEWHLPLFAALERRKVNFGKIDLRSSAYHEDELPQAKLYYNMVSPSAYKRGNQRAVPYSLALCRHLESQGARVLNGSVSVTIEMSKSAQISLMKKMGVDHPKTMVFNNVDALRRMSERIPFPVILKLEQGGSGARMYLANNWEELEEILVTDKDIWWPDNLLLVQEKLDYDKDHGIVRLEFLGGEFLYAMRVITHDTFNLCPSLVCNPEEEDGTCAIPVELMPKPEFYPYTDTPLQVIANAKEIMKAAGHSSGSVEYANTKDGRTAIYDINANSNLREPIAEAFGIKPFEAVVGFLLEELKAVKLSNG